ncbi:type II secretion system protein F [Mergibacter septicus]|uniref:type II secretion system F family protein n=1 Tax=Mergibacter septicus TaxID=221402 RepID=UPI00117930B6|nr:type II secretion system F family protein [Mergibacter septicus]AWX13889.1 type II secretion system protein F [Mergibacter septicus]
MPEYRWRAIDQFQLKQQGKIIAESAQQAKERLLQQALSDIRLQRNWQFKRNPDLQESYDFLQQFALLLQAGVPLAQTLYLLRENCQQLCLYQWLGEWLEGLELGLAFSATLQTKHRIFSLQERQLLRSGEVSGQLAQIIQQLALAKAQQASLQQKIQKILFYPLVVLSISLLLTLALLWFIVPQFADLYQNQQANLPALTAFLLLLSNMLHQHFISLLCGISATVWLMRILYQKSIWLQQILLRIVLLIPLIRTLYTQTKLVNFTAGLALMLQAGITLPQALRTFLPHHFSPKKTVIQRQQQASINPLDAEIERCLQGLEQGYSFSQSLSYNLFPQQAKQMLALGEKSGNLVEMLQHISRQYQQKLAYQIDLLSQLLEPLLMLVIGGLIGMVMAGMYLPIFNLGSTLG